MLIVNYVETEIIMYRARYLAVTICAILVGCLTASASPFVTGNGFGFAVVSPQNGAVTKFYAHPYSFARPDPKNPLAEGAETANFIRAISWQARRKESDHRIGFPAKLVSA